MDEALAKLHDSRTEPAAVLFLLPRYSTARWFAVLSKAAAAKIEFSKHIAFAPPPGATSMRRAPFPSVAFLLLPRFRAVQRSARIIVKDDAKSEWEWLA